MPQPVRQVRSGESSQVVYGYGFEANPDVSLRSADRDGQSVPRDDKALFAGEAPNCGAVLSEPIMWAEKPTLLKMS